MPSWASEIDQLDAAQAAPGELAQEGRPEGLGLGRPDVHAEHLAPAVAVDADGDDHRDGDDAAGLADLHVGRVDPEIGPVALDRPVEEGLHPLVDLLAQPADLALGDAAHAHGLDQIVDRAGRDALDVGLLDHRGERLLGHAGAARGSPGSRSPCAAWGCAARPCRPGSPSPGRDSRCAAPAARRSSRHRRRRSARRPPAPSGAGRQSRSSRAAGRRPGPSRSAPAGSSSRRSSVVSRSGWRRNPTLPASSMTAAKPPARQRAVRRARERLRYRRADHGLPLAALAEGGQPVRGRDRQPAGPDHRGRRAARLRRGQEGQGQKAPSPDRYPWLAGRRHRPRGGCPGP